MENGHFIRLKIALKTDNSGKTHACIRYSRQQKVKPVFGYFVS